VPVAVYWGRAPQKEGSWLRLLLVEDWAIASRLRKFFQVLLNGRETLIEIGDPVPLRSLLGKDAAAALTGRRAARALRALYARQRAARIGPDLSHRRTIVTRVLRASAVRAAMAQEMREKKITRRKAMRQAQRIAEEIAANYSHAFVRFMEHLLTRLWNRLYDGIVFGHVQTLARVAEGHEVVYVPCHRSHMDYLLLSYAIYREGYAIPHIAAGINLNMPVVGRFLRKGGAFFIRRSFRGSALYTVVFMSYLGAIMARYARRQQAHWQLLRARLAQMVACDGRVVRHHSRHSRGEGLQPGDARDWPLRRAKRRSNRTPGWPSRWR